MMRPVGVRQEKGLEVGEEFQDGMVLFSRSLLVYRTACLGREIMITPQVVRKHEQRVRTQLGENLYPLTNLHSAKQTSMTVVFSSERGLRNLSDGGDNEKVKLSHHESAQLLLVILVGLLLSQLAETILHRYHIHSLPGSGAVILIGCITGAIIMFVNHDWEVELEVRGKKLISFIYTREVPLTHPTV